MIIIFFFLTSLVIIIKHTKNAHVSPENYYYLLFISFIRSCVFIAIAIVMNFCCSKAWLSFTVYPIPQNWKRGDYVNTSGIIKKLTRMNSKHQTSAFLYPFLNKCGLLLLYVLLLLFAYDTIFSLLLFL